MTVLLRFETLRQRRREMHMTQEMLAERCDCSPRYLRALETGEKRNPSAGLVWQIAAVLEIPMEKLLLTDREA